MQRACQTGATLSNLKSSSCRAYRSVHPDDHLAANLGSISAYLDESSKSRHHMPVSWRTSTVRGSGAGRARGCARGETSMLEADV